MTANFEIALRRDHLSETRGLIITRSLGAAAIGALPIPMLDGWLAARIRRGTIRKLAERRGMHLSEAAVIAVADGPEPGYPSNY